MTQGILEPIAIHEAVLLIRRRMGLSIRVASKRAGLSRRTWAAFEHGNYRCLRLSDLSRMLDVLGFSLSVGVHPKPEERERDE